MTKIIAVIALAAALASFNVTAEWVDGQRVQICTERAGSLYVGETWLYIGEVVEGCRVYPRPGELVDVHYAPTAGRVYCVVSGGEAACAQPLPSPKPYRVFLPVVQK